MAGRFERRPSATTSAIGKAMAIDSVASSKVSGSPPQRSVSTLLRPSTLPYISVKKTASTPAHSSTSQGFQQKRTQLATSRLSISKVATSGRHCSSNG